MADSRSKRQELYDRIRETSRQTVILEEMKKFGFWNPESGAHQLPDKLLSRQAELEKELHQLLQEDKKFRNREALLKEMRLKRMEEARRKREETKKRREQERFERAEAWKLKKESTILYLGEHVSAGLNNEQENSERLAAFGLPSLQHERALADLLGIPLKELKFLSFDRKVSTISHYRKFYIPKKSGGRRLISAPMPRLKRVQMILLTHIFNKVTIHPAAQGFCIGKSIRSNAAAHVGQAVVVNADLKNFFPSVSFKRVQFLLMSLGYSEKIALIMALLCTEAPTEEVTVDGRNYFVQLGDRVLPQGAPTSPAITNILCFGMDRRLEGLAKTLNCTYTRYADDMSFSSPDASLSCGQLIWRIRAITTDEGFVLHPDKIRVMRKGARQEVTGIVVNERLSVPRDKWRRFRALLHRVNSKGPTADQWADPNFASGLMGYMDFIRMVDPARADNLHSKYRTVFSMAGLQLKTAQPSSRDSAQQMPPGSNTESSGENSHDTPWWDVVS